MSQLRDRRQTTHPTETSSAPSREVEYSPRRRRWPYVLLLLLGLILVLPNVVTLMGLEQRAINMFTGDLNGQLKIGRASAGWFQPLTLKNVSLLDANQQPVVSIAEVKSSNRLWSFARSAFSSLGSADYGHFELTQPVLNLQLRQNGSNLEDVLANYLAASPSQNQTQATASTSSISVPRVSVSIIDGAASITSVASQGAWSVDQVNANAQVKSSDAAVASSLQCRVTPFSIDAGGTPIPQGSGNIDLIATLDRGQTELQMKSIDVAAQSQTLPLSILGPLAERLIGPTAVAGSLNCQLKASCDLQSSHVQATVESMNLTELQLASNEILGDDVFRLASANATGKIDLSPSTLWADQFQLTSDVGRVEANGQFEMADVNRLAAGGQLPDSNFQMHGNLDLARLMQMLPSTFHTHQDLQLQSGIANFQIGSQQRQLLMNVDMANLKARRGGQEILWQEPINLSGTLASDPNNPNGLGLKNVRCKTDFLTIAGNANLTEAVFDFKGDLDLLTKRIGQFVDLQQMAFGGNLTGKFGWQLSGNPNVNHAQGVIHDRPINMIGSFVVTNPRVAMPGLPDWKQNRATIQLEAALNALSSGEMRVDSGLVNTDLGSERIVIELAQPIPDLAAHSDWTFNARAIGDAGGYLRHIQNFVDLGDIKAGGDLDLSTGVALSANKLILSGLNYTLTQPRFDGYGLIIREPQVTGAANLQYDLSSGVIDIADTTFSSSAVSASGQNLQLIANDNIQLSGNVALRANVNRVADWLQLSPTDDSVFLFGDAEGTVRLTSDASGIGGIVDMKIAELTAAMKSTNRNAGQTGGAFQMVSQQSNMMPIWTEKQVGLSGAVKLANDFDAIALNQMQLSSNTLSANASGTIGELSGRMVTDLNGVWNPNWELVNSLLDVYTGRTVRLTGTGEQPFVVRGPIFESPSIGPDGSTGGPAPFISSSLQASTRVAWAGGDVLEMPIGQGITEVIIDQAVVSTAISPTAFSGGQIQMSPKIDLRSSEPVLYLDRQRILDSVQMTPETCASALKYINPLAAGATSAEGTFSIDSDGVQVPLYDPLKMRARATVTLQNVVVSAGPMAEQLIGAAKQLQSIIRPDKVNASRDYNTWLKMSEQTVPISVENGRVYHEGIRFSHDDIQIETSGSVGLDQSVNMVARIPIPEAWLTSSKYLDGLKGQAISIPITGTVSKPVLDRQAIRSFSGQLAKAAAGNAINKVLADKISPKLNQYQSQLNEKLGGEINKVQSQLQSQLQDKLQQNLGNQLKENLGGSLQQQMQNRLGGFLGGGAQSAPGPAAAGQGNAAAPATGGATAQPNLEKELIKGIGNLFGR